MKSLGGGGGGGGFNYLRSTNLRPWGGGRGASTTCGRPTFALSSASLFIVVEHPDILNLELEKICC